MVKTTANKLSEQAKTLVRQWIVMGLTNGEIRYGLAQRGFPSDLNDSAFTLYRRDPQVLADAEAVVKHARIEGMAARYQRIRLVHGWLTDTQHRIKGTTALKDNPDVADAQIEPVAVDNATFKVLIDSGVKLLGEMSRLVDDPVKATATITQKDSHGNVTGNTTDMTDMTDPTLRRIATLAQANDAMEAVLTILEEQQAAQESEQEGKGETGGETVCQVVP